MNNKMIFWLILFIFFVQGFSISLLMHEIKVVEENCTAESTVQNLKHAYSEQQRDRIVDRQREIIERQEMLIKYARKHLDNLTKYKANERAISMVEGER